MAERDGGVPEDQRRTCRQTNGKHDMMLVDPRAWQQEPWILQQDYADSMLVAIFNLQRIKPSQQDQR